MAVNKVVFGAVSVIDISDSTVTADTLAKGATAYDKSGEKIVGTMESGGGGEAASLKIGGSPEFGRIIIYPGGTQTMKEDMENIDCKVGDLIGVISQAYVTIEMGCVLTYKPRLFEEESTGAMHEIEVYYFTITASNAAINVLNPLG